MGRLSVIVLIINNNFKMFHVKHFVKKYWRIQHLHDIIIEVLKYFEIIDKIIKEEGEICIFMHKHCLNNE